MKNLEMTPLSSSPSDLAPCTRPISRRMGGMSAMKMTSTSGGSMPVASPDTILRGPVDGRTLPAEVTHFWMAPTGMRYRRQSAMNAPHTPTVRTVRSHDRWARAGHRTAPGAGAPVTCQTEVSWWWRACVASTWVRRSANVTNAAGSGTTRAAACLALISPARKVMRSTQYCTASTFLVCLAVTPYRSRAHAPATAPRTARSLRLTLSTPRRFWAV